MTVDENKGKAYNVMLLKCRGKGQLDSEQLQLGIDIWNYRGLFVKIRDHKHSQIRVKSLI